MEENNIPRSRTRTSKLQLHFLLNSKLQLHFLPNHEEAEVHRWRLATRLHLPFKKARGCLETCTAFEGEEERFFFISSHRSHGFISVVFATALTLRKSSLWMICDLPIFRFRPVANPESVIFGRKSSICREGFRRPSHFRLLRSLLFFQPLFCPPLTMYQWWTK